MEAANGGDGIARLVSPRENDSMISGRSACRACVGRFTLGLERCCDDSCMKFVKGAYLGLLNGKLLGKDECKTGENMVFFTRPWQRAMSDEC